MSALPVHLNAYRHVYAVYIYPGESWTGPDGTIHTNKTGQRIDIDPQTSMPFSASQPPSQGGEQ